MKDTFVDKYGTAPATRRTLNHLLTENAILRIGNVAFTKVELATSLVVGSKAYAEVRVIRSDTMAPHAEGKSDLYKTDALVAVRDYVADGVIAIGAALNQITTPLALGTLSGLTFEDGEIEAAEIPAPVAYDIDGEYATYLDASELITKASNALSTIILLYNRAADRLSLRRITDRGTGTANGGLVISDLKLWNPVASKLSTSTLTDTPAKQSFEALCANVVVLAAAVNGLIDHIKSININPAEATVVPTVTAVPAIAGTREVGQTLSVDKEAVTFTGSPAPVLSIRWSLDGQPLGDETDWNFVAPVNSAGKAILATVYATNAAGEGSLATASVTIAIPTPKVLTAPKINGVFVSGSVVNVDNGVWDTLVGVPVYEFRWLADNVAIAGQTAAALTITDDLAGKVISAEVRVKSEGGSFGNWAKSSNTETAKRPPFILTLGELELSEAGEEGEARTVTLAKLPTYGGSPAPTTILYAWNVAGTLRAFGALAPLAVTPEMVGNEVKLHVRLENGTTTFEGLCSDTVQVTE